MIRARRAIAALVLLAGFAACSRSKAPPPAAAAPAAPAPAEAPAPPEPLLGYELRLGRATFRHYCSTCHGETGAGDGFNAFNVDPHPRDLSDPTFQKAKSDADLADTVRRGGAGVGLSPLMPPWGKTLTADQIDQVVQYVRTLKKNPA